MNEDQIVRKVLVVDDDPHLLNLLDIRLTEQGFNVTIASSAHLALDKIKDQPPDLVIADIMMPGMDGYELCEKIRETERLSNIPFVFLSALADTEDKVKGLRLGADDYLTKPFEFHELLARIEILLDRYSRYRETFDKTDEAEIATSGKIEDLGIIDLLQMLSFGQKTGEVSLESGTDEGALYLMSGKLIAAGYRNKYGIAALPTLLSWNQGKFTVKLLESLSVIPTIQNQTDEAIFEALRELDETERIKQDIDVESVPAVAGELSQADEIKQVVLDLVDGKMDVHEILLESPLSELATIEAIRDLVDQGILVLKKSEGKHEKIEAQSEEERTEEQDQPEQQPSIASRLPTTDEPAEFNLMVVSTHRQLRNTFIHLLSGEDAEQEEEKVLNFGRVVEGPYRLNLYGLPGAKRFAPLWQTFVAKVQGIVVLTNWDSDEEIDNVRFMLSVLRTRVNGPAVIINTDPAKADFSLGEESADVKIFTCLPSDRSKSSEIVVEIISELIR